MRASASVPARRRASRLTTPIVARARAGGALALAIGLAAGCGSGLHYGAGNQPVGSTGTLQVTLDGTPACNATAVNLTIQKVRVHTSATAGADDVGWVDIVPSATSRQNLAALVNGKTASLGQTGAPPGTYAQVRVIVQPTGAGTTVNSVVSSAGEQPLDVSALPTTGVVLGTSVPVAVGQSSELVLTVDACRSVVPRTSGGNAVFDPVMRATDRASSGAVQGTIDGPAALAGAIVSAQKGGMVLAATTVDGSGAFTLSPIAVASSPVDVVVRAPGRANLVVSDVPLSAGATTRVSSGVLAATTSATRTVSGVVTPTTAKARVRALQLVGGSLIEAAITVPPYGSGAYTLSLPAGAPLLAPWSATAGTLAFLAQFTDGEFTIEVSAPGYVAQTSAVDVAASDQARSFSLVP